MGNGLTQRYMLKQSHSKMVHAKHKVSVSGGFGILLAVLLFLDEHNVVPWALMACLFHELGHGIVICLLGGEVKSFTLTVIGAEIIPTRKRLFSYREELLIAAAGPLMSFICAMLSASFAAGDIDNENALLFSGLNLMLGLFNLLPAGPLDGGRILKILLMHRYSFETGEQRYQYFSALISVGLLALGIFHILRLGGNITLLLTGVWLLAGARQNQA